MKRTVCFGEIMMRLNPDGHLRFVQADRFMVSYAGGEASVAVSLANFGLDSSFVTKLPTHELGQAAVNALRKQGLSMAQAIGLAEKEGIKIYTVGVGSDQQLTFIRSTNKIDIQSVNAKENLAWKDGLLKYKSIALCTLLNELEKRYEIPIHIENKRLLDPNVTVSGTFSEDQSLKEILQVISRSLPIKWSQRDGTYYIQ